MYETPSYVTIYGSYKLLNMVHFFTHRMYKNYILADSLKLAAMYWVGQEPSCFLKFLAPVYDDMACVIYQNV